MTEVPSGTHLKGGLIPHRNYVYHEMSDPKFKTQSYGKDSELLGCQALLNTDGFFRKRYAFDLSPFVINVFLVYFRHLRLNLATQHSEIDLRNCTFDLTLLRCHQNDCLYGIATIQIVIVYIFLSYKWPKIL